MTAPRPQQPLRRDGGEPPLGIPWPGVGRPEGYIGIRPEDYRLGLDLTRINQYEGSPCGCDEGTHDTPTACATGPRSDADASDVSAEGKPADGPTEAHAAIQAEQEAYDRGETSVFLGGYRVRVERAARLIQGDNTVLPSLAAEAAANRLGEAGMLVGQYAIKALDIPPRVPVPPWPTREEWEAKVTEPLLASPPPDFTPHAPGEADPEWRHWAKGEIQRLTEAVDDAVTGQAYWKDWARETETAYDALTADRDDLAVVYADRLLEAATARTSVVADLLRDTYNIEGGRIVLRQLRKTRDQRDRARDLAARLESELAEQAVEWGYRDALGVTTALRDLPEAREYGRRNGHCVVSRRVGPWTEEA